ncbi:MAG TPA: asparaginase [Candidatus Methylomirabilis sp.]
MSARQVHVFNTGGTISHAPAAAGGAELTHAPDRILAELGAPRGVRYRELFRKGSVSMTPADWGTIATAVYEAVRGGTDGVIVLHGTDTMAYTAAALSFMLGDLPVPVVLTGSMLPGGAPGSDAPRNIRNALRVAAHGDVGEVCIVFSDGQAGTGGLILRGNRARKVSSSSLRAFETPNHPVLGCVEGEALTYGEAARMRRGPRREPMLSSDVNPNVCLLRYHPGCSPAFVADALARAEGAVIEGTGLGHLPPEGGILEVIRESGRPVVLVTACWHGGVRHGLYDIDRAILAVENLIPGRDLTPEAALVKLMWVLGRDGDLSRVKARMQEPVAGELTPA